jgi:2-phospho-L-lactate transferase/gluconeogenesis factor (CofD/UPF0052 family)
MLNIVVINGGRGAGTLIPELVGREGLSVTSVVNAYDDGKSTGEIRRFFGILGPSDLRKVQQLMLPESDLDFAANLALFEYRYPVDQSRDTALAGLRDFAQGVSDRLCSIDLTGVRVREAVRTYVRAFVEGLEAIEQAEREQFSFADCSIMNCIYAGACLVYRRNIETATLAIDRLFKLRGTVLPTSIENKKLVALRENGEMLYCEADIVELRSNVRVERIYLLDNVPGRANFDLLSQDEKRRYLDLHHCFVGASPRVVLALQQADIIVYSAGTQHSSLYPTYLSSGIASTIAANKDALKVFVTNIGADYETPMYTASDYFRGAWRYLDLAGERDYAADELFDAILINQTRIKADESYVDYDEAGFAGIAVPRIVGDFESASAPGRHDGTKLVEAILARYEQSRLQGMTGHNGT